MRYEEIGEYTAPLPHCSHSSGPVHGLGASARQLWQIQDHVTLVPAIGAQECNRNSSKWAEPSSIGRQKPEIRVCAMGTQLSALPQLAVASYPESPIKCHQTWPPMVVSPHPHIACSPAESHTVAGEILAALPVMVPLALKTFRGFSPPRHHPEFCMGSLLVVLRPFSCTAWHYSPPSASTRQTLKALAIWEC